MTARCLTTFCFNQFIFFFKHKPIDILIHKKLGIARPVYLNTPQHLSNNHFDMLIVDAYTLQTIDIQNFSNQILLNFRRSQNRQ